MPASLYGEGLVRAFDRLSVRGDRGRRNMRGRFGSLVIVAVSPVLLLVGLATTSALSGMLGNGLAGRLLGVYLAFLVGWLSISVLLLLAYRGLAPERPGTRALHLGRARHRLDRLGHLPGLGAVPGHRHPARPAYGGSVRGAAAAVSFLWLYLLHLIVLVGYVTTLQLVGPRRAPARAGGAPAGRAPDGPRPGGLTVRSRGRRV